MTLRLSEKDLKSLGIKVPERQAKPKSKYNSKKISVDGITFDSQAEANYYCQLKILLKAGEIDGFCRQARFVVTEGKNGEKGTEYVTDFVVFLPDGKYRIIDVKGVKTDVFKLKVKCLREKYPKLKIELES